MAEAKVSGRPQPSGELPQPQQHCRSTNQVLVSGWERSNLAVAGQVLSRDGGLLAVGSLSGQVVLFEVGRRGLARRLGPLPGFHAQVVRPGLDFLLSPRIGTFIGGRLAISDGTGSIFVWSTPNP